MSSTVNEVLSDALSLSPSERGLVAARLIGTLDERVDDAVDQAWTEEIGRRFEQIDSGKVTLIPWETARRIIQGMATETDAS